MLLAEPLFATLWGCAFLSRAGGHEALLQRVAQGRARLACAVHEGDGRHEVEHVACRALPLPGGSWQLDGAKAAVLHGAQADALIVSARTGGDVDACEGITLFVLPADTAGLSRQDCAGIDGLRVARLTLQAVQLPASALLGDAPRRVGGFAGPGMPWSLDQWGAGPLVVSKAGAFGGPDALLGLGLR